MQQVKSCVFKTVLYRFQKVYAQEYNRPLCSHYYQGFSTRSKRPIVIVFFYQGFSTPSKRPIVILFFFIRAFRLRRKDLLLLCFFIIFFFLDKCWSNILSKRQAAVKKYYYIYVGNCSAIRIRLCQLPVPALPVSRRQFVFDI